MNNWKKSTLGIILAMNSVGLGVALFLTCGLGSDSIGLLCDGLRNFFQIRFGTASLLYNLVVIGIAFFINRKSLGAGSIIYALFSGYFIDLYGVLLEKFGVNEFNIILRMFGHVFGELIFALGLAILIQFHVGMNALDAVILALTERWNISYTIFRWVVDFTFVICGVLMGGVFGIGTIFSSLMTGMLVTLFVMILGKHPYLKKIKGGL